MNNQEDQVREAMMVINDALIAHFQKNGEMDPALVISTFINLVNVYCEIMGIESSSIFQQAISVSGTENIGGIGLEFE